MIHGKNARVSGGKQTLMIINTPQDWCDYYSVRTVRGMALLYKALNADYSSPHGTSYKPGLKPTAPDWDGGAQECGGGLHFSPTPLMAMRFINDAKRFVGCWVRLTDMAVHPDGEYPEKCKASRVAEPCFEVDTDGKPVAVDSIR